MSWHEPETYCLSTNHSAVRYGVQKAPNKSKNSRTRHVFAIGQGVTRALGWKAGDRITIAFGAPGTEHASKALVRRLAKGRTKLVGQKNTSALTFQTSFVSPWINEAVHSREDLTWRKSKDVADALEIDLPAWSQKAQQGFDDSPRAIADKGSHGPIYRQHSQSLNGSSLGGIG